MDKNVVLIALAVLLQHVVTDIWVNVRIAVQQWRAQRRWKGQMAGQQLAVMKGPAGYTSDERTIR